MEIQELIDLYQKKREEREKTLLDFLNKKKNFIIRQPLPGSIWGECNTIETIYDNNIKFFENMLRFDWTDDLPFLEPWIGTGVYATGFGCEYKWRDDNAPDVHYKYHKIEEIKNIEYPDWKKSKVMQMVLDCIDYFKEKTKAMFPISLTDTQSPFDTATLILDAVEFFTACYTHEEIIHKFMNTITDLIIEFSVI